MSTWLGFSRCQSRKPAPAAAEGAEQRQHEHESQDPPAGPVGRRRGRRHVRRRGCSGPRARRARAGRLIPGIGSGRRSGRRLPRRRPGRRRGRGRRRGGRLVAVPSAAGHARPGAGPSRRSGTLRRGSGGGPGTLVGGVGHRRVTARDPGEDPAVVLLLQFDLDAVADDLGLRRCGALLGGLDDHQHRGGVAIGARDPGADDLGVDHGLGVDQLLAVVLELPHGVLPEVPGGHPPDLLDVVVQAPSHRRAPAGCDARRTPASGRPRVAPTGG